MAKLRLVGWMAVIGGAAVVLLRGLTWTTADPVVVVMTAVRGVAGLLAAYLFVATVLAVRLPRVAPRFVARLVAGALGTGLLVAPLSASADPRPRPPAEVPVLHRVPDQISGDSASLHDTRSPEKSSTIVVAPGEHLWSISERELAERLGRVPTDDEVVPFWLEVIDLNRDRVVDPDLVFAGQVLRLPS